MNLLLFTAALALSILTTFVLIFERHRLAPVLAVVTILYVRVVRHLGPDVQTHSDSYFYFFSARAMLETRSLQTPPGIAEIYPFVTQFLKFPLLPVLTVEISELGRVTSPSLLRIGVPVLFGPALFVVVWLLYRYYLPGQWALAAAFSYTLLDVTIAHHVIYHQQAIGTVLLLFFLFPFVVSVVDNRFRYITLLFATALPFTHKITPYLGLGVVAGLVLVFAIAQRVRPLSEFIPRTLDERRYLMVAFYAVVLLSAGTLLTRGILTLFVAKLVAAGSGFSLGLSGLVTSILSSPSTATYNVAKSTTLVDTAPTVTKIVSFLLALPGLILAGRHEHRRLLLPMTIGTISVAAFFLGLPIAGLALIGRFMVLGYLLAILVGCYAVVQFVNNHPVGTAIRVVSLAFVITLLVGNVFVIVNPSRIDPDVDINGDGYPDIQPVGPEFRATGDWIREYTPKTATVATPERPDAVVFYYGLRPWRPLSEATDSGYALNDESRFPGLTERADRYYTNGRLTVSYGRAEHINPRYN